MVATTVLISLCVAGLTAAAPQVNQEVLVTDVVNALQPSIAAAVANALRGLGGSTSVVGFAGGNSGSSFGSTSSSFGSSSGSRFSGSSAGSSSSRFSGSSSGSSSATGFAAGGSGAAEEVTARPEYNFSFKVADDDKQTYINQDEQRDGDQVVGSYSYIDPNGDLITVNYEAGPMGYTQTSDKQVGAVQIRAQNTGSAAATGAVSTSSNANRFSSSNSASSSGSSFSSGSSSSSAAIDQSALIARIISALQPQISSAVSAAVGQQQSSTSFRTTSSSSGFRGGASAAAGDRLTPLFGNAA